MKKELNWEGPGGTEWVWSWMTSMIAVPIGSSGLTSLDPGSMSVLVHFIFASL